MAMPPECPVLRAICAGTLRDYPLPLGWKTITFLGKITRIRHLLNQVWINPSTLQAIEVRPKMHSHLSTHITSLLSGLPHADAMLKHVSSTTGHRYRTTAA
jgi:hypothetical protein